MKEYGLITKVAMASIIWLVILILLKEVFMLGAQKKKSFFLSKVERLKISVECEYWVKGYFSGNQPEPPSD